MRVTRHLGAALFVALFAMAGPVHAQTYFPFGSVNIGTSSTSVRVGPVGCAVATSDPTFTTGQVYPFSCTTDGKLRITGPVTISGTPSVTASIAPGATVAIENLAPSADSVYAATPCYLVSAASTNSTNCKAAAGNFYGIVRAVNATTTIYYLRLYNLASAPTCSSATGFVESVPIPPAVAAGAAGGIAAIEVIPTYYSAGIGFCLTGGSSSTDNSNAATGIFVKLLLK